MDKIYILRPCLQSRHCLSKGAIGAHLKSPYANWFREMVIVLGQNDVRFFCVDSCVGQFGWENATLVNLLS